MLDPYGEDLKPLRDEGFGAYAARVSAPTAAAVARHFDPAQASLTERGIDKLAGSRIDRVPTGEVVHPGFRSFVVRIVGEDARAWLAALPGRGRAAASAGRLELGPELPRRVARARPARATTPDGSDAVVLKLAGPLGARPEDEIAGAASVGRRAAHPAPRPTSRARSAPARADRSRASSRTPPAADVAPLLDRSTSPAPAGAASAGRDRSAADRRRRVARVAPRLSDSRGHARRSTASGLRRRPPVLVHGDFDERNLLTLRPPGSLRDRPAPVRRRPAYDAAYWIHGNRPPGRRARFEALAADRDREDRATPARLVRHRCRARLSAKARAPCGSEPLAMIVRRCHRRAPGTPQRTPPACDRTRSPATPTIEAWPTPTPSAPAPRSPPAAAELEVFRLDALQSRYDVARLPYTLRVLLENVLRREDGVTVTARDVEAVASWNATAAPSNEITSHPARVLLQDFTGVPAVVDLAAMRARDGRPRRRPAEDQPADPGRARHRPLRPGRRLRHALLDRAQLRARVRAQPRALRVPPLGPERVRATSRSCRRTRASATRSTSSSWRAWSRSATGRRSPTRSSAPTRTRRWSTGSVCSAGASAGSRPRPRCSARRSRCSCRRSSASGSTARCPKGATATDLVLTVTQILRQTGVVGKFVEYFGHGLAGLPLADRATIGNMSPEYGATCGFFPVDDETLRYLRLTGRSEERVALVEAYCQRERPLARPGRARDVLAGRRARSLERGAVARRSAPAAGPRAAARRAERVRGGAPVVRRRPRQRRRRRGASRSRWTRATRPRSRRRRGGQPCSSRSTARRSRSTTAPS